MKIRSLWFFLVLFGTSPLYAQEGPAPKLFMLPTQGVTDSVSTIVPERIGEMLRNKVGQETAVELMPDYETILRNLGGSGHSSAAVADAEQIYTSGIGLLTAGNDKEAVKSFTRALEIMEANLADVTNFDILADTIANLALANFNAGFDLDARKNIKQYAHMRPEAKLDAEKFPKELIKIHTAEVKKVKKAGPGKLNIKSSAEGTVYIDGVEKGKAPMTITDVGFGHHYIVVNDGKGGVYADKIRVRGKKRKQTFTATLQPSGKNSVDAAATLPPFYVDLNETLVTGTFDNDIASYLSELANQTGADFIAWTLMYRKGTSYDSAPFVFRAEDQKIVAVEPVAFNLELSNLVIGVNTLAANIVESQKTMPDEKVIDKVQLVEPKKSPVIVKKDPVKTQPDPVKPPEPKPVEPPPSDKTSGWTYAAWAAGGIAAVGLIAGGIFLLTSDSGGSSAPGFNTEVAW